MAHVAFSVIPFAGHINPTLAVVTELVARGHRVTYPITAELADRVKQAGAEPVIYRTTTRSSGFQDDMLSFAESDAFTTTDFAKVLRNTLAETVAVLPQFARAYAGDQPDLVVYDPSSWTGRLLALRWHIPTVCSMPTMAANEHWSLQHGYSQVDDDNPELPVVLGGVTALLGKLKLGMTAGEFLVEDDCPTIVYVPKAFQYEAETFPDTVRFVGPCLGAREFHGRWRPPDHDPPVVLMSMGTFYNREPRLIGTCVEAFADTPWHVVVSLGGGPEYRAAVPSNVEVHPFVPLTDVLAHTDVFINHGGMGTVLESLHAGVPMVVVPHIAEQQATADRVTELGLGQRLDAPRITAAALRDVVVHLASDRVVRQATRWMQDEIAMAGGAVAAADVVDETLGST